MSIPNFHPAYRVELVIEKKKHFYDVFAGDNNERTHRLPGTTGFLDIIAKPALIPWSRREALSLVEQALFKRMNGQSSAKVQLDSLWINELMEEARKRPDKIKDDAADLGTRAHAYIDLIIHGKEPALVAEDIAPAVQAFREWWKNSGITLLLGDTRVASIRHGFGGSLDAIGSQNGKIVLLDWKTSNSIHQEFCLQASAYCEGFFETYGIYCQEAYIVRFGKKLPVDFEVRRVKDIGHSFQSFIHAKNLKQAMATEHYATNNI